MRISDWSSDVCSSDLPVGARTDAAGSRRLRLRPAAGAARAGSRDLVRARHRRRRAFRDLPARRIHARITRLHEADGRRLCPGRSEEHTSELQSLMSSSYAVFCLKKKKATSKTIVQIVEK